MSRDLWRSFTAAYGQRYGDAPWLLSKWETVEGVVWPAEKIGLMLDDVHDKLALSGGQTLLDVGCGSGWIAAGMKARGAAVVALDFAAEMAAGRTELRSRFVLGDARALPIGDGTFDRVLVYFMLMNYPETEAIAAILREVMRVLRPGGRCLAGQFPLAGRSAAYDWEKARYMAWCESHFELGPNRRADFPPPVATFSEDFGATLAALLDRPVATRPSFNHFWREGEPPTCSWRVDYLIDNVPTP